MSGERWSLLTAGFPLTALEWRVLELSDDSQQASLRPQLRYGEVVSRLNTVLSPAGWSNRYLSLKAEAVCCELSLTLSAPDIVTKSTVVPLGADAVASSQDAFVRAAELFGLLPPADTTPSYWVDYDPDTKSILFEPEFPLVATFAEPPPSLLIPPLATPVASTKSEGQQAIDRLIERLKTQGQGLEVAKLVMKHGGYGDNADAARDLYRDLRNLLVESERGEVMSD